MIWDTPNRSCSVNLWSATRGATYSRNVVEWQGYANKCPTFYSVPSALRNPRVSAKCHAIDNRSDIVRRKRETIGRQRLAQRKIAHLLSGSSVHWETLTCHPVAGTALPHRTVATSTCHRTATTLPPPYRTTLTKVLTRTGGENTFKS